MSSTLSAVTHSSAFRDGSLAPVPLSMAFQPIVDVAARSVFAYEALVRGIHRESAESILAQVTPENLYAFDQSCRFTAVSLASQLGIDREGALLSINFMPGAVYSPSTCIQHTLHAVERTGFPLSLLMFEISEMEEISETARLQAISQEYRRHGLTLALDDFGAGYSGVNLLADLDIHVLKLDGKLIRDIDRRPRAEEIVRSTATLCRRLGIRLIAECVETLAEYEVLRDCGITLMQGYLFAQPGFECLPEIAWPEDACAVHSLPVRSSRDPLPLRLRLPSVA